MRPGFQGSETSWAEITVYQHGDDPIILLAGGDPGGTYDLHGRKAYDAAHCVIGLQTQQALNNSGTFSIQLKPSKVADSIFNWLTDDDWIDIVWYRHDRPWHTFRGLVDDIIRGEAVTGSGATSTVYTIVGRGFQKIWEISPVWFSPHATNDLVTEAIANQVFESLPSIIGDPVTAVKAYLQKFLEALADANGPNWNPPAGMPGIEDNSFLQSVGFPGEKSPNYFSNVPARKQFNPNYMMPQGTLWQLAQQHSDPMFTELFTDLYPNWDCWDGSIDAGDEVDPQDTRMTVVLRDKPFPVVSPSDYTDSWDSLPVFTIPRQSIVNNNVGRSGAERFNAFYVSGLVYQEALDNAAVEVLVPLIDMADIQRHGLRRLDITTQMVPDDLAFRSFAEEQRKIIRDWYALNPYYLSGNIMLGHGRPDIKIGCRALIPGEITKDTDETYYIEQVTHQWAFGRGIRTSLGVTRGWVGSDDSHMEALQKLVDRYTVPTLIRDS